LGDDWNPNAEAPFVAFAKWKRRRGNGIQKKAPGKKAGRKVKQISIIAPPLDTHSTVHGISPGFSPPSLSPSLSSPVDSVDPYLPVTSSVNSCLSMEEMNQIFSNPKPVGDAFQEASLPPSGASSSTSLDSAQSSYLWN
jgi:hypothetical protein